ncbi:hypothetical protein ACQ4PT_052247 [Festuca glaucescens]
MEPGRLLRRWLKLGHGAGKGAAGGGGASPAAAQVPQAWPWGGEKRRREEALKEEKGTSHVELQNLHPRWTPAPALKHHRFLTHSHCVHLAGITTTSAAAFNANQCTGTVMFLLEGAIGNVLHTGDCQLTPDCIQGLPLRYITVEIPGATQATLSCRIDYLFLDCTFSKRSLQFPAKEALHSAGDQLHLGAPKCADSLPRVRHALTERDTDRGIEGIRVKDIRQRGQESRLLPHPLTRQQHGLICPASS